MTAAIAPPKSLIICGARVFGFSETKGPANLDHPPVADILVENGIITAIETDLSARLGADAPGYRIEATDRLAAPGFVNAHYHSHDTLLKGAFEAVPLDVWSVLALPPAFPPRSLEEIRIRTLIGAVECLMRGITTLQDMVRLHPFSPEQFDVVLDAYEEVGIRAVVAPHFNDLSSTNSAAYWDEEVPQSEWWRLSGGVATFSRDADIASLMSELLPPRMGRHRRISLGLGPSAPERCSESLLRATARISEDLGVQVFTHVAESRGKTLHARRMLSGHGHSHIDLLADCGLLGPRLTIAHAIWLEEDEITRLRDAGAHVVLNVVGNLKTRSGVAPIETYRRLGANISLGCDNCSCNDAQSMLQVMKTYAGLGAVAEPLGDGPSAEDALHAGTLAGARALGLGDDVGRLAVGSRADIVLFDLGDPCFVPLNSAVRQLVFGEAGTAVDKVLVDGYLVVDGGRVLTVDFDRIRGAAEAFAADLRGELAVVADRVRPLYPHITRAAERALGTEWRRQRPCC